MKLHISHVLTLSDEALAGIGCTKEYLREYFTRQEIGIMQELRDIRYLQRALPTADTRRPELDQRHVELSSLHAAIVARINSLPPVQPINRPLTRASIRRMVETYQNGTSHGD